MGTTGYTSRFKSPAAVQCCSCSHVQGSHRPCSSLLAPALVSIPPSGFSSCTLQGLWADKSASRLQRGWEGYPRTQSRFSNLLCPPASPAELREAPSGTREAGMGVSKASQAPGPLPNTQITLAEDSPVLRKISAATSGTPHSAAIFRLLVLICKDINVPTISKYTPESANSIFSCSSELRPPAGAADTG